MHRHCIATICIALSALFAPIAAAETETHNTIFGVFYTGSMNDETRAQNRATIGNGFLVILLGLAAIVGAATMVAKSAHEEKRRQETERREQEEEHARSDRERRERTERMERESKERREAQQRYRSEVRTTCDNSSQAFLSIPRALMTAEELLDTAEKDFSEEAFSPFWDAIERAVNKLGEADRSVETIANSVDRYNRVVPLVEGPIPKFPVELDAAKRLVVANETGTRLKAIVRTAQRNFQFATIYEQRKTNQILVAGFNNLGDAIVGLGDQISYSIHNLCDRVSDVSDNVKRVEETIQRSAEAEAERHRRAMEVERELYAEQVKRQNEESLERTRAAEKGLEMLDNIQRGRRPYPYG